MERRKKILAKDDILPFQLELKVSYIIVGRWWSCEANFCAFHFSQFPFQPNTRVHFFAFFSHSHFISNVFFFYKTICLLFFVSNICRTFCGGTTPYQTVPYSSYIHLTTFHCGFVNSYFFFHFDVWSFYLQHCAFHCAVFRRFCNWIKTI